MGKVYLVGAGPGAADLLTVRAARLLAGADVVLYDALVHPEVLALAPQARQIAVGKRCGAHSMAQPQINALLIEAAAQHALVVRLKGGDPMLFGRAQEEIDALTAAGIDWEVVPGITAALAASAELGAPLTARGVARSVIFATPRTGAGQHAVDWAQAVAAGDTAALYMATGQADIIRAALLKAGVASATPLAIVENASLPDARRLRATVGTLTAAVAGLSGGPAIVLVGEVYRPATPGTLPPA